ncbi:MAG: hypothetical protein PF569_07345 [Candidatus Woesearchaeota archaeon]|jgi:hypothetical protein|nr:hypothetical protein [Candidatus Woesearchaeota archaeon]
MNLEELQNEINTQNQRKGEIISLVVSLEGDMEFFISKYFARDSNRDIVLSYSILSDITIEKKKQYIFEIIKFQESTGFNELNKEIKEFVNFLRNDFDFVIQKRNAIAHWHGLIDSERITIENRKRVTTPKDRLEITKDLVEEIKIKKDRISKSLKELGIKYK